MIETTYALLADLVDKVRIGVPVIGVLAAISDALHAHTTKKNQNRYQSCPCYLCSLRSIEQQ